MSSRAFRARGPWVVSVLSFGPFSSMDIHISRFGNPMFCLEVMGSVCGIAEQMETAVKNSLRIDFIMPTDTRPMPRPLSSIRTN